MCMPMIDPAPGRLSTITVCFNRFVSSGAMMRATMSVLPPGAHGTRSRTGFSGHALTAAEAGDALANDATTARAKTARRVVLIEALLRLRCSICYVGSRARRASEPTRRDSLHFRARVLYRFRELRH